MKGEISVTVAESVPATVLLARLISDPVKPDTPSEKIAVKWIAAVVELAYIGSAWVPAWLMVTETGFGVGVRVTVAVRVRVAADVGVLVLVRVGVSVAVVVAVLVCVEVDVWVAI